ncbi:cytochrome P450 [Podospora australis]|uniref:Cytochrome P450 n=1 Tax=Podospora australis TaxID=1536484 RepID=A0AAN6WKX6_9PEZI|nr:cytochrome P450 [Podospora australis]
MAKYTPLSSEETLNLAPWLIASLAIGPLLFTFYAVYNLYFHPLSHIPGPFWARASGIPSWGHALTGKRHIWLWQQFEIYGNRIRIAPNTVLFRDAQAYSEIYGMKSNVRRSPFYTAFQRNKHEKTTLNTIDIAEHAAKRKLLNLAFTDKTTRAASEFMTRHVDRWNELLLCSDSGSEWTAPVDMSEKLDTLVFDIMGDLCFGRSFDIKEPDPQNPLRQVPHNIAEYMKFYYPMCRSPFLSLLLWLKPRGLDAFFELVTPPAVQEYNKFVHENITSRIALHAAEQSIPEAERRQDIFYFLAGATDPDTGKPVYKENDLRAESSLLIIAGSDTTSVSLSGIFFYLTANPRCLDKLTAEIRSTFSRAEDIVHSSQLLGCQYLRACVDEGMRLTPSGPCELPREVLEGGILIKGEYYPPGTIVATVPWVNSRNQEVYGPDAEVFRPERWIVEEAHGVTKEEVKRARDGFHPFLSGPGNCVGKNVAMAEMLITLARTLHRLDVRRAPGSTVGGGGPDQGWGARDAGQFQLFDAYISLRKGPEVQFRGRRD